MVGFGPVIRKAIGMVKQSTRRSVSALAAAATALLLWTPIAGADDPPDCDQLPADQQQKCQQDKAAAAGQRAIDETQNGVDKAKQAADQAKQGADQAQQGADQAKQGADQAQQGADQAKQGADQAKQKSSGGYTGGAWMLVNGVPTCVQNGAVFVDTDVRSYIPPNGDFRC